MIEMRLWLKSTTGLALVAVAILLAVGCVPQKPSPPAPKPPVTETPTTPAPAPETVAVRVYLLRGESVGVASRQVEKTDDPEQLLTLAITELLKGPSEADTAAGLGTTIPSGTELRKATIRGDTASIDLSRQFESGGGSLSMMLRVAEVIYTATQFEGVERVSFLLDGTPAEAIGGEGIIVSPAVGRADFEGQAPPILLESPAPGDAVNDPVTIEGTANVFEAQFSVRVLDADKKVLAEAPVHASSGTGTRGDFQDEIEYPTPATDTGYVVVFDTSEKDGSEIYTVEVPVAFK